MEIIFRRIGKPLFLLVLLLSVFAFASPARAQSEFETSYDVTYDVMESGITTVTQKITLKNLTSQYYASNFSLTIGSTTISDVTAIDEVGVMETKVEGQDGKTAITVIFNQQVAGMGKQQSFTLRFKTKDFADKVGKTWEVNLPKSPEGTNVKNYSLVLSVPAVFGEPTSISPLPKSKSVSFDRLFFAFDKSQLQTSGVSVNFGSSQNFDFNLKYHLINDQLFPELTYVALPPDTVYQDIVLNRISPQPLNVTVDSDGNYLAWYKLPRRSVMDIYISGSAKLYIESKVKKVVALQPEQVKEWTKADDYWQKDDPQIKATIKEIFKEEVPITNREKAEKIYRYVVNTLSYDTSRLERNSIERLGAVTVLRNPSIAICMEFTDLFITLMRAVGVPARELDGFAYSQNKDLRPLSLSRDLLHAWPEYFDEKSGWIMVDPTWENTSGGVDYFNKFDLNHLVLTIRGKSSRSPYSSDDVKVSVSTEDFSGKPQLEVQVEGQDRLWSGFPATLTVKVVNLGNTAALPSTLTVSTSKLTILENTSVQLGTIPPFGFASYPINLRTPNAWQTFSDTLIVNVADQQYTQNLEVKPIFMFKPFPYIFLGLIGIIFTGYFGVLVLHLRKSSEVETRRN